MNKVLVTGLGLGFDFDVCGCCALDFSWLIENPSTLVWADKIIITKKAWQQQIESSRDKFTKAVNLVLQIANSNGLVEIVDPNEIFTDDIGKKITYDVKKDMERLEKAFPELIKKGDTKKVPNELLINDKSFCGPYVASIYASLKLGEELQANCLLSNRDYEYLKFKFGLAADAYNRYSIPRILDEVFTLYLPDELVLHNYAFTPESRCSSCARDNDCKDNYLFDVEKNAAKLVKWRSYDEIIMAKRELDRIIDLKQQYGKELIAEDVKREFSDKQQRVNRNINRVFPLVKRWTNLTTVIATPISIYSAATGNAVATVIAASALGVAKVADEAMKYYENRNNWVGFINNIKT